MALTRPHTHPDFRPPLGATGRATAPRAFTLVEVLISIAIALLLIIAISQIFGIAQRTTGTGQALLGAAQSNRGLQGVFARDIRAMVPVSDTPAFVIASYSVAAFRNLQDFNQASNPNDPRDFGNLPNNVVSNQPFSVNSRIHRLDRMGFFARDAFHRQTSDAPFIVSSTTSNEAFIWIGHLALPNNPAITAWDPNNPAAATGAGGWFNPGQPSIPGTSINDNNLYAASWILGRQVTLLVAPPIPAPPYPESGYQLAGGPPFPLYLLPPSGAPAAYSTDGTTAPLCSSRYDLSYTTIADWTSITANAAAINWWQYLSGLQFTPGSPGAPITLDQRYYANPYPNKGPNFTSATSGRWTSAAAAQTSPIFLRGCTQFIVEFAGDFATQNPSNGVLVGPAPDGEIDYILDRATGQRRIRWYGFPRNVANTAGALEPDITMDENDVLPVSTYLRVPPLPFERTVPPYSLPFNAMNFPTGGPNTNFPYSSEPYVCAWSGGSTAAYRPRMLRITVAVDDANGRLNAEQTYEYIYTLP